MTVHGMTGCMMRSFVRVGAAVALASAGAIVAIGSGTAGAEPQTVEFEFTGEAQEFVVPAGVCSVTVDAFGAEGGTGTDAAESSGLGGLGGHATATFPVTDRKSTRLNSSHLGNSYAV